MPRKKGDKAKLTPTDNEWILQTYALTGNKAETARRCKVALKTVYNVLEKAQDADEQTKEQRASAAAKLQTRVHVKAEELLDSITPDDMESGRIRIEDKEGNLVGYKYFGPSLLQKATAFGIVTDKANVIQTYEKGLHHDSQTGQLMLPGDIEGLKGAIQGKLKELRILDVRFADDNPDLVRQTQEIVAEVERIEEKEASRPEITSLDDLDKP